MIITVPSMHSVSFASDTRRGRSATRYDFESTWQTKKYVNFNKNTIFVACVTIDNKLGVSGSLSVDCDGFTEIVFLYYLIYYRFYNLPMNLG